MKKLFWVLVVLATYSGTANAGDAKLNWGKFEDFADVQSSHENKEAFHDRVAKEIAAVFSSLAKKLPEGVHMEVNVTDLDLAGEVRFEMAYGASQIRVMRAIHWPRMNFTYELKNAQGEVVASGKEELRDMDYLSHSRIPSGHTSFEFEEKMIQDWFRKQVFAGHFPSTDTKSVAATK